MPLQTYCSDAVHEAMRNAGIGSMNSFSWGEIQTFLNNTWRDVYQRLVVLDPGYYSTNIRLTKKCTKMPPFVMNSINVFHAKDPTYPNPQKFRESGWADLNSINTFHISGFDLYCPAAEFKIIWCTFVPQPPDLWFPAHSRDPRILDPMEPEVNTQYLMYFLTQIDGKYWLFNKRAHITQSTDPTDEDIPIHEMLNMLGPDWEITYLSCDHPYLFMTLRNLWSNQHKCFIIKNIINDAQINEFNPFAYNGRDQDIEYIKCHHDDFTGLGVVIKDYSDGLYKEVGFTPDTLLVYPCQEMYRLVVARLAEKFSLKSEANRMIVQSELASAEFAFDRFLPKNKASWQRISNVNSPTLSDLI